MRGLIACIWCIAGCDGVFGLPHIYDQPAFDSRIVDMSKPPDAKPDAPPDSGCSPPTGGMATKSFGAGGFVPGSAADTFISSDTNHQMKNFGGLDTLFVCYQCTCAGGCESITGDDDVVALLRFGFGTEIPACSTIISATLHLTTTTDNLSAPSEVRVYRARETWDEGNVSMADGSPGTANWTSRTAANTWTNPGAAPPTSRDAAFLVSFAPRTQNTSYAAVLPNQLVQQWLDDPTSNHGLVLVVEVDTSEVHFFSAEDGTATRRPSLEVMYQQP